MVLLSIAGTRLSGKTGESLEFFIYSLIGLIVPIFVLASAYFGRFVFFQNILSLALLAGVVSVKSLRPDVYGVVLATLQTAFLIRKLKLEKSTGFFVFLFSLLSWSCVEKLVWWDLGHWLPHWFLPVSVLVVSFALIYYTLFTPQSFDGVNRKIFPALKFLDLIFTLFLLLASFKVGFDFHHGSFYTGPAELVRQGGILLWDVPSQYGFLNILTIALVPVESTWRALSLTNSTCIFISAILLYLVCVQVFGKLQGRLLGVAISVVFVQLLPGYAPVFAGPQSYPSTGALRFLWCYILLFLVWNGNRKLILAGTAAWTLSIFWSFESAIYGSVIWLPYVALVPFTDSRISKLKTWIAPVALCSLALTGLVLFYRLRFGFTPDFNSYFEFAKAYKEGFYSEPIDLNGGVWFIGFTFASALSVLFATIQKNKKHVTIETITALCSAMCIWAVSSYFISRSHENNITNITPLLILASIITLGVLSKNSEQKAVGLSSKILFATATIFFFVLTIGNRFLFPPYFEKVLALRSSPSVIHFVPKLSEEVENLFVLAGVKADEPMVILDRFLLGKSKLRKLEKEPVAWLPIAPEWQICILAPDRRETLFQRFKNRVKHGGWLLFKKIELSDQHCLSDRVLIQKYYRKTNQYSSENWILERYE